MSAVFVASVFQLTKRPPAEVPNQW